jgi:hypothetical protein
VVPKEDARKKVLDNLIEKTRSQPNYTTITRVIKIVKQVFFAGQSSNEEKEEGSKKEVKTQAMAAVLLSNAGEYRRLLEFFMAEVPKHILKLCSISEKTQVPVQYYDLKKLYGHLSSK